MKKRIFAVAVAFLMLAGCGGQKTPDVGDVADGLKTDLAFNDTLTEIDEDTAYDIHGLSKDDVESIKGYINSGASAEEILVLKSADDNEQKNYDAISQYVEDLKESVKNYQPEQFKLMQTNTYLSKQGKYVILCISADDTTTAEKAALKYFK